MIGIVRNPTLRDLKNIPAYFTDPSTFAMGGSREWRPVLQITYALNYFMAGLNPLVFRISNLLFHLGTSFLIFLIVAEICMQFPLKFPLEVPSASTLLALLSALLFAVHTVNSEAVDYIWSRSSVLAALFYLLTFYCFLRGPFSGLKEKPALWRLAGLISFALGLGTKATAVTLPAILLVYEFLFLNPASKNPLRLFLGESRRLKKYIPVITALLAYIALRLVLLPRNFRIFLPETLRSVTAAGRIDSTSYLLTQFRAWVHYLRLFLWPHPLIVDFSGFGWSYSLWDLRVLLSLALVTTILVIAWRVRKTEPLISFFTFWFFIALFPEASFIPLTDPVVGYRAYLAYVGPSVVGVILSVKASRWIWSRLHGEETGGSRFWTAYGWAIGIIVVALIGATIMRNRDWRDEATLWGDVIRKDPTNSRAYMGLGVQFLNQGDYGKAQEMFEKAVQFGPREADAYALRGYLRSRFNRNDEALSDFAMAIRLDPRTPYTYAYRGDLYNRTGELEKALSDFHRAIALLPYYGDAYFGLALAYLGKEEVVNATEACAKLVEIDGRDRRGYDCLGTLLIEQNRFPEAVKVYEQATARIPEDSELWRDLGNAYQKNGMHAAANKAFTRANLLMHDLNRKAR